MLVAQGGRVDYLYFPTTAFLANTVTFDEGHSVLPFVMGSEGVTSLAAFLAEEESLWAVEVRVGGGLYRLPASAVRERMDESRPLRRQLARLSHDYQAQAAYGLGCAVLHKVEKRLAGLLLTTSDRLGSDTLSFSQTDLAEFLGMQRTTINTGAQELKRVGAVHYSRGHIRIIDREALIQVACECYAGFRGRTESQAA